MHHVALEDILPERALRDVGALNKVRLRLLSVLPILQHVNTFSCFDSLLYDFKLDKDGSEADRPVVVSPVLQRMQFVIVCSRCQIARILISLQSGLATLGFLHKLGVGLRLLLLLIRLFLRLEKILLLVLLGAIDENWSWHFQGDDGTILRSFIPYVAIQVLEVVQVLRRLERRDVVDAEEARGQGHLVVLAHFIVLHLPLKEGLGIFFLDHL